MIARAVTKYVRISPRKMGFVVDPLRKKTVAYALNMLSATNKRAATPVFKTIASAYANARVKDPMVTEQDLVITKIVADEGPTWKRFRAAAFGRAVPIVKRTSHITVELDRK